MGFKPSKAIANFSRFMFDVGLRWYHGGIGDLAAGVTFWVLVSLPAFVLAMLAVLGPIDDAAGFGFQGEIQTNVQDFADGILTDNNGDVKEAIASLFNQSNPGLFTISIGFALWSISRGFAGLLRALEDTYGIINGRPWYIARVVAVVLGLGTMLISLPLIAVDQLVWAQIGSGWLQDLGRYAGLFAGLVLWALIVFYFGLGQRHRWRDELPGAVAAALLWVLLYLGFDSFVGLLSGANQVRAAVGAGLFALTWIWLAAQALLIGGAVNYLYSARRGVVRSAKPWGINETIVRRTGELKKIVIGGDDDLG